MKNYIEEFEEYKEKIPEFIVKLYHILESKEYNQFICWHGENQVLIKNSKKIEERVLPHFFRHKHLSSFIRQLNMYKFSKVNKLTKQKNYMYFRNEHFKRGMVKQMIKIKRNNKKNRKDEQEEPDNIQDNPEEKQDSQISINRELENNNSLQNYKLYVKNTVKEIAENLKKIETNFPDCKQEIGPALALCNELMEVQEFNMSCTQMNFDESQQNKNMLSTMRLLPRIESIIFPSQYSLCQFN